MFEPLFENKIGQKDTFLCDYCKSFFDNKQNLEIHCLTCESFCLNNLNNSNKFEQNHNCIICKKKFKSRSGLWYHKKKCLLIIVENDEQNQNQKLLEQNQKLKEENIELKNIILELYTNMKPKNKNIKNKTFHLHFFLNEICKNALNWNEFINSIQIQLIDLENVGKSGFVSGITNIFVKNLKMLDIVERPIHCNDKKREILYIKDNNQWIKNNDLLKKAIINITNKNISFINEWKNKYPDCIFAESKKSDLYNKIVFFSMDYSEKNYEKIIRKIIKEVRIIKSNFFQ
jgi:hypothetical protein